jgi:hypothetical protein
MGAARPFFLKKKIYKLKKKGPSFVESKILLDHKKLGKFTEEGERKL